MLDAKRYWILDAGCWSKIPSFAGVNKISLAELSEGTEKNEKLRELRGLCERKNPVSGNQHPASVYYLKNSELQRLETNFKILAHMGVQYGSLSICQRRY